MKESTGPSYTDALLSGKEEDWAKVATPFRHYRKTVNEIKSRNKRSIDSENTIPKGPISVPSSVIKGSTKPVKRAAPEEAKESPPAKYTKLKAGIHLSADDALSLYFNSSPAARSTQPVNSRNILTNVTNTKGRKQLTSLLPSATAPRSTSSKPDLQAEKTVPNESPVVQTRRTSSIVYSGRVDPKQNTLLQSSSDATLVQELTQRLGKAKEQANLTERNIAEAKAAGRADSRKRRQELCKTIDHLHIDIRRESSKNTQLLEEVSALRTRLAATEGILEMTRQIAGDGKDRIKELEESLLHRKKSHRVSTVIRERQEVLKVENARAQERQRCSQGLANGRQIPGGYPRDRLESHLCLE